MTGLPFNNLKVLRNKLEKKEMNFSAKISLLNLYKAVLNDSLAFEVAPIGSSGLFGTFLEAYTKLFDDGNTIDN